MNAERREKRTACFDMQTFNIHYPMSGRGKMKVIPKGKLGHYPIALIPGQFVDYYEKFTPEQLKYLPLNTTLKMPPPNTRYVVPGSDVESKYKIFHHIVIKQLVSFFDTLDSKI